jgi:predicted nucleic acid-binding protein
MPSAIGVDAARSVLSMLRALDGHGFLPDDVSLADEDIPTLGGYRQVTDAHLLTLARRNKMSLLTFDAGVQVLAQGRGVELLRTL